MKTRYLVVLVGFLAAPAGAQSVLSHFDNALFHSSLPLDLPVGGISAQFSATEQGFSIQPANSLGFTPAAQPRAEPLRVQFAALAAAKIEAV